MKIKLLLFLTGLFLLACSSPQKEKADLIIHNAVVYTVDSAFTAAESFAVKDGKIIAVGTNNFILEKYAGEKLDVQGKALFPGFIDAHCHFYGYGNGLNQVLLVGTKSFDEVIQRVVEFSQTLPLPREEGSGSEVGWIVGRGWDQNDWDPKEFPTKDKLDSLFPNTPVFLKRVDGHAALVNSEAFRRANITEKTKINGGIVEVKEGNLTGILVDNAVDIVSTKIPPPSKEEVQASLLAAQKNCFEVGLTTVDDAGLDKKIVDLIDEMHKKGELKMRGGPART